jgi:hypothetical protein
MNAAQCIHRRAACAVEVQLPFHPSTFFTRINARVMNRKTAVTSSMEKVFSRIILERAFKPVFESSLMRGRTYISFLVNKTGATYTIWKLHAATSLITLSYFFLTLF